MDLRGVNGISLAEAVGVTPVSISNIVKGKSFPKPDLLLKISAHLDVDIRELFNPTKKDALSNLNGFVEHEGVVYKINNKVDLENILTILETV